MPKTTATISHKKLAEEICKEIDDMNNTGFGSAVEFVIGQYLGFQVQIKITRDEDDMLDVEELNNDLITFSRKA